jgi:hypothetical protein
MTAPQPLSGRLPASRACRGPRCGAAIAFVLTEARKRQAVDPEPAADGNLVVWRERDGRGSRLRSRVVGDALFDPDAGQGDRYGDHHATCPDADRF